MTVCFKEKPLRDRKYIKYVSGKPCSVCGASTASDPHHYQPSGNGKMGGKIGDDFALPLCNRHHSEYHRIGRESFKRKYPGWDPEGIISRLREMYLQLSGKKG